MRGQPFNVPVAKPQRLGPEHNPWFWNPSRFGVQHAPRDFDKKLKDLGEELAATWNPIKERWQVWAKSGRINHKICSGWRLLFINQAADGSYMPLDERTLARLWEASGYASRDAKAYFERIVTEMERDRELREKYRHNELIDSAMPSFDHSKIQVSGYGKSNGSKFSTYHAG